MRRNTLANSAQALDELMSTMRTPRCAASAARHRIARRLAAFDASPELPLGGDDQVLVERIGVGFDFDPLAATRNDREDRTSCRNDPHVMLQLGHVFFRGRLLRK